MRIPAVCLVASVSMLYATSLPAQKLPTRSSTVFKCEKDGKVAYSDAPCLGGERLEVKPTRGLNKMSGVARVGDDVRAERFNEVMADALRPVFGESAEQRAKRLRRAKLPAGMQAQCRTLDEEIAETEGLEKKAAGTARVDAQTLLFRLRRQYSGLRC